MRLQRAVDLHDALAQRGSLRQHAFARLQPPMHVRLRGEQIVAIAGLRVRGHRVVEIQRRRPEERLDQAAQAGEGGHGGSPCVKKITKLTEMQIVSSGASPITSVQPRRPAFMAFTASASSVASATQACAQRS
jgi:hypothetical protein